MVRWLSKETNMGNEVIWNKTTRILHWAVAIPVALNFFIDGGDASHKTLGSISLAALIIRLFWGLKSNDHANFKSFPLSQKEVKNFLLEIGRTTSRCYPGHNPMASWTYILIWICVIFLGATGFMMGLDTFWGEEWLEKLHGQISTFLTILVVIHFTGLIFDSIKHKRKTWLGMITGKRL